WVGTQNGLFRFAGNRFRRYDRSDGIPNSYINSLHQSRDGVLWVGTRTGLARYDGDRFKAIATDVKYEILSTSAITSDEDGVIYVGTPAGLPSGRPGPSRADRLFGLIQSPPSVSQQQVSAVHFGPSGIWFGCGSQVCRMEAGRFSVFGPELGVPPQRWDSIVTGAAGDVWIRSSSRLLVLPKGGTRFISCDTGLPKAGAFGRMYVSKQGELFVATYRGLDSGRGGG